MDNDRRYSISERRDASTFEIEKSAAKNEFPEKGWGVFAYHGGISSPANITTELVSVHKDQDEAISEAARLNRDQGFVEYEVTEDSESTVWQRLFFDIGELTFAGAEVHVEFVANYEATEI